MRATVETRKLLGDFSRQVAVRTNDPTRPLTELTIQGRVVASFDVFPQLDARLSNRAAASRRARRLLRKDPAETADMAVSELRTPGSWLTATARRIEQFERSGEGLPPGRPGDWVIDLALVGPPPPSLTTAEVRFKTGLSREPDFHFDIVVEYLPLVTLSVEEALLSAAGAAEPQQTVLGSVRRGFDPARIEVKTEPAGLRARLEPSGERGFTLQLAWPGATPGAQGHVTLVAGEESARLPVTVAR